MKTKEKINKFWKLIKNKKNLSVKAHKLLI